MTFGVLVHWWLSSVAHDNYSISARIQANKGSGTLMQTVETIPTVVVTSDDLLQIRHHVESERAVLERGHTMIGDYTPTPGTNDPLAQDYSMHARLLGIARDLLDYIESTIDTYVGAVLDHSQFLSFLRFALDAVGRRKILALSFLDLLDTPEFSSAVARRQPVVLRLAYEHAH